MVPLQKKWIFLHIEAMKNMIAILQMKFSIFLKKNQFDSDFTAVCSNLQLASIGTNIGLVPNRWEAIIWMEGLLVYWCI